MLLALGFGYRRPGNFAALAKHNGGQLARPRVLKWGTWPLEMATCGGTVVGSIAGQRIQWMGVS